MKPRMLLPGDLPLGDEGDYVAVVCPTCGAHLQVKNRYGLTTLVRSCSHFSFSEVYPGLWEDDERDELYRELEQGRALLLEREQGGYYLWEER